MQYRIIGDTMPAVEVLFDAPGEAMYTQSGGMAWMSEGISMDSNMKGGLGKSIGRMFSGESLFMATYRAERAAQESVNLNITFTKKFSAGLFGGEGFILQDISGSGMVFLEIDGNKVEKNLAPGEVLKVDTGNVVAFERSVSYEIETVKGIKNILLGGEGLFLTKLTGPGKVILQTQNFNEFAGRIIRMVPSSR